MQESFAAYRDVDVLIFVAPWQATLLLIAQVRFSLVHRDLFLCDLALLDGHIRMTLITVPCPANVGSSSTVIFDQLPTESWNRGVYYTRQSSN